MRRCCATGLLSSEGRKLNDDMKTPRIIGGFSKREGNIRGIIEALIISGLGRKDRSSEREEYPMHTDTAVPVWPLY
jgi:hypothetical protein